MLLFTVGSPSVPIVPNWPWHFGSNVYITLTNCFGERKLLNHLKSYEDLKKTYKDPTEKEKRHKHTRCANVSFLYFCCGQKPHLLH